jgi:homoprotocatechuate degradation regulator HpaR
MPAKRPARPAQPASEVPLRPFSQSLPMSLLRAREAVMKEFRPMLREHGLTEQQWRILRAVSAVPSTDASALAVTTCLLGPSLSRILPELEQRGLITRKVKPDDLRVTTIAISAAGQKLIKRVTPDSEAAYRKITDRFGARKLEDLRRLLAELEAALT